MIILRLDSCFLLCKRVLVDLIQTLKSSIPISRYPNPPYHTSIVVPHYLPTNPHNQTPLAPPLPRAITLLHQPTLKSPPPALKHHLPDLPRRKLKHICAVNPNPLAAVVFHVVDQPDHPDGVLGGFGTQRRREIEYLDQFVARAGPWEDVEHGVVWEEALGAGWAQVWWEDGVWCCCW